MKKATAAEVLPKLGAAFEGGYFAGVIHVGVDRYALVLPPKAQSEHERTVWNGTTKAVTGAASFHDGLANTNAMAKAGSQVAKWALEKKLYIPARDELELLYRAFKPGKQTNWCYRGDNPSSEPVGYVYSPKLPAQSTVKAFRTSGAEAFEETWYWSSTQFAGYEQSAWYQTFYYGYQYYGRKDGELCVRAVRRVKL